MGSIFSRQPPSQKKSADGNTMPLRGFYLDAFPPVETALNTTSTESDVSHSCHHSNTYTPRLLELYKVIETMAPMDKDAMGGRCLPETARMERFMKTQALMTNIPGEEFVQGVKAFRLTTPVKCELLVL